MCDTLYILTFASGNMPVGGQLFCTHFSKDASLGEGFCIGHSYFCGGDLTTERLRTIIEYDIKPMLREYWFDNDTKYQEESGKLISLVE